MTKFATPEMPLASHGSLLICKCRSCSCWFVQEAGLDIPENCATPPPALPLMRIVLIGGPCSGKGTIAPLLSQALRTRVVSVGQLLRGEVRSGTPRGGKVREVMERGELLQDSLVLDLVRSRVTDSWDAQQNGWQVRAGRLVGEEEEVTRILMGDSRDKDQQTNTANSSGDDEKSR